MQKPDQDNASMCDTRATDRASSDGSESEGDNPMGTDIASRTLTPEEIKSEAMQQTRGPRRERVLERTRETWYAMTASLTAVRKWTILSSKSS